MTKNLDVDIDSVGWNWQNANDATTGAILLGTSKGKNLFQLKTTMYSTTKNGTRLLYPYNTLQLLLIRTLQKIWTLNVWTSENK
jgi:hypothetical protein